MERTKKIEKRIEAKRQDSILYLLKIRSFSKKNQQQLLVKCGKK